MKISSIPHALILQSPMNNIIVIIQWTGLLDYWTTGILEYWNGLLTDLSIF